MSWLNIYDKNLTKQSIKALSVPTAVLSGNSYLQLQKTRSQDPLGIEPTWAVQRYSVQFSPGHTAALCSYTVWPSTKAQPLFSLSFHPQNSKGTNESELVQTNNRKTKVFSLRGLHARKASLYCFSCSQVPQSLSPTAHQNLSQVPVHR